jgi:hypothetical protein
MIRRVAPLLLIGLILGMLWSLQSDSTTRGGGDHGRQFADSKHRSMSGDADHGSIKRERRIPVVDPLKTTSRPTPTTSIASRRFAGWVLTTKGQPCSGHKLSISPFGAIASGMGARIQQQSHLVDIGIDGSFSVALPTTDYPDEHCWCLVVGQDLLPVAFRVVPVTESAQIVIKGKGHPDWGLRGSVEMVGADIDGGILQLCSPALSRVVLEQRFQGSKCDLSDARLLFPPARISGPLRLVIMSPKRTPHARVEFENLDALREALRIHIRVAVQTRFLYFPTLPGARRIASVRLFLRGQLDRANSWPIPLEDNKLSWPLAAGPYEAVGLAKNPAFRGFTTFSCAEEIGQALVWGATWPGSSEFSMRIHDAQGRGLPRVVVSAELRVTGGADDAFIGVSTASTDADGWARFMRLPPGTYRFAGGTPEALGARRLSRVLQLPHAPIQVEMPQITCLYLDPLLDPGVAFDGVAAIHARHIDSNSWRRLSVAPGHDDYYVRGLPPGLTEFFVKSPSAAGRLEFAVAPTTEAQPVRVRLTLTRSVQGHVTRQSKPVSGVLVSCSPTRTAQRPPQLPWLCSVTDATGSFRLEADSAAQFVHVWSTDRSRIIHVAPLVPTVAVDLPSAR